MICPTSNTIQNYPARTGAGSDNNKRQQRDSATQTVKIDYNNQNKSKVKPAYERNRVNVAVIGDSMVNFKKFLSLHISEPSSAEARTCHMPKN